MSRCPALEQLEQWLADRLAGPEAEAVDAHVETCAVCQQALERLTECYLALGVNDEAQAAAAVLGYNFPGSDWYEDSYALLQAKNLEPQAKADSWLNSVF